MTSASISAAPATLRLHVIDKDSNVLGSIPVRVGLRTYAGPVTRFTDKTVWTRGKSGIEAMHRKHDGRLPSVYRSHAKSAEVAWTVPRYVREGGMNHTNFPMATPIPLEVFRQFADKIVWDEVYGRFGTEKVVYSDYYQATVPAHLVGKATHVFMYWEK